jgi:choline dehydrogenase-like flavoprotein
MPAFPDAFSDDLWRAAAEKIGATVEKVPYAKNSVERGGRPPCSAYSICHICPIGAQYSADVHIAEAEASGLCDVIPLTVARRVEVDNKGVARAVHATGLDGKDRTITARRFVIAAHSIESARLMLLSSLGKSSGHLGRNLMEHFYVSGEAIVADQFFPGRLGFETLQCASFYNEGRRERGAIKLELGQGVDPHRSTRAANLWGKALAKYADENFSHVVTVSGETEHVPHAESSVELDPAVKDMFGDPAPRISFHVGDFEDRTRESGTKIIARLLEAAGGRDISTFGGLQWASHHLGTFRMGATPDKGVVDTNLKVFGTSNLYAVGGGNFVTGGALQPTLTIAALALRLGAALSGAAPGGDTRING